MDEIVPNSIYDHDEHGEVRVIKVENGVVHMQKENETVHTTAGVIPGGATQSAAGFRRDAEPATVEVEPSLAVMSPDATEVGR